MEEKNILITAYTEEQHKSISKICQSLPLDLRGMVKSAVVDVLGYKFFMNTNEGGYLSSQIYLPHKTHTVKRIKIKDNNLIVTVDYQDEGDHKPINIEYVFEGYGPSSREVVVN